MAANLKLYEMKQLADDTFMKITSSVDEWKSFLRSSSRVSSYSFKEQLLIYAQNPNATACASFELWNEKMHCLINRGAKGIALIDSNSEQEQRLKYVFDVADVHEARNIGHKPVLWEINDIHKSFVIERLESVYGVNTDEASSFEEKIHLICDSISKEVSRDLVDNESLFDFIKDFSFEELSDLITAGLTYSVLSRCNADTSIVENQLNFERLKDVKSLEELYVIGTNISDLSSPILKEIGRSVRTYNKLHSKEVNNAKSIENGGKVRYNTLKRESDISDTVEERSEAYGNSVHSERGLSDTKSQSERGTGGNADQVGLDVSELSEGVQAGDIRSLGSSRETESELSDDSASSTGQTGYLSESDGESGRDRREAESRRSDEVGSLNEQYTSQGGGDSERGDNLRLETPSIEVVQPSLADLFPSFNEQVGNMIVAEARMKHSGSATFVLTEDEIDDILRAGGNRDNNRSRIFAKLMSYPEIGKDRLIDYLKKEYGEATKGFIIRNEYVSVLFDEDGMNVGHGTSAKDNNLVSMDWGTIAERLLDLFNAGKYMSKSEAASVDASERSRIADSLSYFYRDNDREYPEYLNLDKEKKYPGFPDVSAEFSRVLTDEEDRIKLLNDLFYFSDLYKSGQLKNKWRFTPTPDHFIDEIAGYESFLHCKQKFDDSILSDQLDIIDEKFVTQDEIDAVIKGGSNVVGGKKRIYEFFSEGHDSKENAEFLKKEYGWGGSSHPLIANDHLHKDHDPKGLKIIKGSYLEPNCEAVLSWKVVEKRIRELIADYDYLTVSEIEEIEAEKEAKMDSADNRWQIDHRADVNGEPRTWNTDLIDGSVLFLDLLEDGKYGLYTADDVDNLSGTTTYSNIFDSIDEAAEYVDSKLEVVLLINEKTGESVKYPVALFDKAKELINEFCVREYDESADFSNYSKVDIATTDLFNEYSETDSNVSHEVQVSINLFDLSINKTIDDVLVEHVGYENLNDLVDSLEYMEFDSLVYVDEDEWNKFYSLKKQNEIDEKSNEEAEISADSSENLRYYVLNTYDSPVDGAECKETVAIVSKEPILEDAWNDAFSQAQERVGDKFYTLNSIPNADYSSYVNMPKSGLVYVSNKDIHLFAEKIKETNHEVDCLFFTTGSGRKSPDDPRYEKNPTNTYSSFSYHATHVPPFATIQIDSGTTQTFVKEDSMSWDDFFGSIADYAISNDPLKEINKAADSSELKRAKELINEYCLDEFGTEANFSDLKEIGVAYTTIDNDDLGLEGLEIQVNINLVDKQILTYVDGDLITQDSFSDLKELNDSALSSLNFNSLISLSSYEWDLVKNNHTPIEQENDNNELYYYVSDGAEFGETILVDQIKDITALSGVIGDKLNGRSIGITIDDDNYTIVEQGKIMIDVLRRIPQIWNNSDARTMIGFIVTRFPGIKLFNENGLVDKIDFLNQISDDIENDKKKNGAGSGSTDDNIGQGPLSLDHPTEKDEDDKKVTDELIEAHNYHIEDDNLGVGSAKEKYHRNIEAINLLKKIESEDRLATPEEQSILSQYVGWGGLSDAFDETKDNWKNEYAELKSVLTAAEYNSARESTLNAHYTSPVIIDSMYEALHSMGFSKGNILEPAMGIGNFFGKLPGSMSDSKLYGVELDDISGRIAKKLYPNADIRISGYENADYPNDFFDIAIGNVPFGNYKVNDKKYDKQNFMVHDYFFAKTLDKVRSGGIVAFVTSKGTLDKESPVVRKYLAQRAELIGAIRLPNTAFKANAGTEVTSDIIFLKKRDRIVDIEEDWVHLGKAYDDISINQYFVAHPEMVLGQMTMVSGPFGLESTCIPNTSLSLKEQLNNAISNLSGIYEEAEIDNNDELEESVIPASPDVKNYSYTIDGDSVYFRENSIMKKCDFNENNLGRVRSLIELREITNKLINLQTIDSSADDIKAAMDELNVKYDAFIKSYGYINSRTNRVAFRDDSSYHLLSSLEKYDEEGKYVGKADIFRKRTIKKAVPVTSCDTASEALAVSLSEMAKVDLNYMILLTQKTREEIIEELKGVIFHNPVTDNWEPADEYLSGNIRKKLEIAKQYSLDNHAEYDINVQSLERVMPKDLEASEIDVRIGATWIPPHYIEDFIRETFQTPDYLFNRGVMEVKYSDITSEWSVSGKNSDYGNTLVHQTYGTSRANAYKILEDSLNLKETRIYDVVIRDGVEKREINKKETMLASQKQESIREAFKDWIFKDPDRRADLVQKYNVLFNSTRPREYDGSHLTFPGMNPDIELKEHQLNGVARILYGNNTLLGHCVGAGKTFTMVAAGMESKRLGLCNKPLYVVPNHLTEQWGQEFMTLYPGANILVATKKDFEPANRKKFCSRIATGDYDAVIIGHSQFEKIPLSTERQIAIIDNQIAEIEESIKMAKAKRGERYTVKQLEKSRKKLVAKLNKLNDASRKDNVVTFEQLGVDRLFVDESHNYKNLFLYTKMRNVAGIAQTEAQKSQDMYNKCRYLDELTGNKGITFATGTPISNSMTELYTNMRYLQSDRLKELNLSQFDAWASTFGETQTTTELAPEGTGYRAKTRFAKFFNLPELISIFKECADIQTPDMLKLPVPEVEYENVVTKPSEYQKEMVSNLGDRAEMVRNSRVDPSVDNMLKITNDGRKLALDQRLMNNPLLPDDDDSKSNMCVNKAFEIWQNTMEQKSAQLIFCDLSTPKGDGSFNVYDDIRNKLVAKGVPKEQIAFIHEANTETRKTELFAKVRSGQVRFLLGSTSKMGAGTNVQDRLIALHHLDVPWRPSDIEQQEGRIIRQGNMNPRVNIYRYITEGTFDAYSWQLIENKQKFIGQIMTSKSPVRSADDIDDAALTYAEVKSLATGNPYIKEKMSLDIEVTKLKLLKSNYVSNKYRLEDDIAKNYPKRISAINENIEGYKADVALYNSNKPVDKDDFSITINGTQYVDRVEAGKCIIDQCTGFKDINQRVYLGDYRGFGLYLSFDTFNNKFTLGIKGKMTHLIDLGSDPLGNITRIDNALNRLPNLLEDSINKLNNVHNQLENAKIEVNKPFEKEEELAEKQKRLSELNALLSMDASESDISSIIEDKEEETDLEPSMAEEKNFVINNADKINTGVILEQPKSNSIISMLDYNVKKSEIKDGEREHHSQTVEEELS